MDKMSGLPKLIFSDNTKIIINNSSFTIGRSLNCDHIIESLQVSRFHCTIKRVHNKWILFDRSTNGTTVNSTLYKFNESVELTHGDIIKLGPYNVTFAFAHSESSQPKEMAPEAENEQSDNITSHYDPVRDILGGRFIVVDEIAGGPDDDDDDSSTPPETEPPKPKIKPEVIDSELICSICSELFIKAVTLNCAHTYCQFCIAEWRKNKSSCPICRKDIVTVSSTLVLDNLIEKCMESQSEEAQQARKDAIEHRDGLMKEVATGSNVATTSGTEVIEVSEDEDTWEEDYMSDEVDYDGLEPPDYSSDYDGERYGQSRRPYYGGYGRCYICSQSGHWANGCPFK